MTRDDGEGGVGDDGDGAVGDDDDGAVGDDGDGGVGEDAESVVGDGADGDGRADSGGADPAVRDAVREDLEDFVDANPDLLEDDDADGDDGELPSLDDPVSPQAIDVEHAAFVVVGVVAMLGLVVLMLGGL